VDDLDRTIHRLDAGGPNTTPNSSTSTDQANAGKWADRNSIERYAVPAYTVAIKNRGEAIKSASSDGSMMEDDEWETGFAKDRVVLFIGELLVRSLLVVSFASADHV